ncbi:peptidylprolyl isomerase [Colwelliaceae bacterium 6471]
MKSTIFFTIFSLCIMSLYGCSVPDQALTSIDTFIAQQHVDKSKDDWKTNLKKPELLEFSKNVTYFWELETNQGKITIKLYPETAPMHVTSTIYLTRLGFYDDLTFHRVIPSFMAQGGDPLGTGRGNPGYQYQGEFSEKVSHSKAGIVSMANAGPGTDGSQFFITFKPTLFLDNRHTVFGEVHIGIDDTLTNIEQLGSRSGRTQQPVIISKASIRTEKKL